MPQNAVIAIRHNKVLLALAMLPAFDGLLNQLSNALQLTVGSVSILQVFRGCLLLCFVAFCFWQLYRDPMAGSRIPRPALAALLLLLLVVTKESVLTGTIAGDNAVAYGQMTYWVLLWIVVSLVCTEPAHANVLLVGLACGALLTAASVVLGFVHGGLNYYEDDAVRSSSGWFNTAKMITGILVSGSIIILYLGRNKRSWIAPLLAVFCCIACILTYARAGTVAMGAVVLWLLLWVARNNNKTLQWHSLNIFLAVALMASVVVAVVVPAPTLFSRWSDVSDEDTAGSGRVTIWRIAVEKYLDGSVSEQVLGHGYDSMSELLFSNYGDDVKHTHNDALDMLLVAGVAGASWLLLFVGDWALRIAHQSIRTVEGAAGLAILINYLCHSQLTGQIWGTDSMTYYMVGMTCFYVIGCASKATKPVRPLTQLAHSAPIAI